MKVDTLELELPGLLPPPTLYPDDGPADTTHLSCSMEQESGCVGPAMGKNEKEAFLPYVPNSNKFICRGRVARQISLSTHGFNMNR